MNFSWKRFLAMVLAIVMVVGMVPTHALHAHAEETEGTTTEGTVTDDTGDGSEGEPSAQADLTLPVGEEPDQIAGDGKTWVEDGDAYVDCGKSEHEHTDECLTCDHKNGHLSTCYAGSTAYEVCPGESDTHTHSGTSELDDVFGWDGSSISWKDHPAKDAVKAIYDAAVAKWKSENTKQWWDLTYEVRAILAGYNAVKDLIVCFTISEGAIPECGHVHTDACYDGSLLGWSCPGYVHEHTYPACYVQNWKEVADVNDNEMADESEYYTVKFVNENGELLQSTDVVYGGTPAYTGETPVKEGDAQYSYTFAGWDQEIVAVTGPAVYTATYTSSVNEYTVKFVNYDGTELDSVELAYGKTPAYAGTPSRPADDDYVYSFAGWDVDGDGAVDYAKGVTLPAVTGAATYKAVFATAENVAMIGDVGYSFLAEAIAAVQNGETIVLMGDCDEDVTIKQVAGKSFTIDGNDNTYTGTITIDGNKRSTGAETLTIQNVNFVAEDRAQASINTVKSTFVHNLTVDGCTFTGKEEGKDASYGMILRHSYNIVVKNTEGTDLYDLVYGNSAVTGITLEDVTVTDSENAVFMAYVNSTATFKNLTVTNSGVGVGFRNNAKGTAVFENCSISAETPVVVDLSTTPAFTVKIVGNNSFSGENWMTVSGEKAAVVTVDLSETANLNIEDVAIPEGYCVKNAEADQVYTIQQGTNVAKIVRENEVKYFDLLADAIAAVQNGDTIILLADNAETVTIKQTAGLSFTIDGNDKTYTGTININGNRRSTGAETLTIKNLNFVLANQWQSGIFAEKNTYVHNLTVDGCTFTGTDAKEAYGIRLHHSYNITVKNTTGTKLYDLVYAQTAVTGFTAENVTVTESGMGFMMPYGKNLYFKNVTLDVSGAGVGIYNYNASSATFEDCSITASPAVHLEQKNATNAYTLTFNGTNTLVNVDNGPLIKVVGTDAVLKVVDNSNLDMANTEGLVAAVGNVYYNSLRHAVNAAEAGDTVKLIADVVYDDDDAVNAIGGATGYGNYPNPSIIYVGGTEGATPAENQPSTADFVLDLNGHSITNNADAYLFLIMDNAKMTIKDSGNGAGVIVNTAAPAIWVTGAETLVTVESGKYTTANPDGLLHATHSGDLVITGGEFSTTADDASLLIVRNSRNYNNPNYFLVGQATVTVSGGTFYGFNPENTPDDITSPFTYFNAVAEGYVANDNGDNSWTVLKSHTITFVDENGNELAVINVADGKLPVAPELTKEHYVATWDPAIVEATGDATYTLVWVPENDVNTNGVADEEETVTVVINKADDADAVALSGLVAIGDGKYAFDSTGDKTVTVVATPVVNNNISATYVAGVEGVEGTGAYGDGYAYTYTFTAENGQTVTVNFAEAKFEYDEDGEMFFYVGMEDPDHETLYNSVIKTPAYSTEAVGENVKYLARTEGEYPLDLSSVRDMLAEIKYVGSIAVSLFDRAYPDAKINITLEEKWLNVGEKLDEGEIDEAVEEAINSGIEEIKALIDSGDYIKAISAIGELGENVTKKIGTIGCHAFGANTQTDAEGNVQEIISVDYKSEAMHLADDTLVVTLVDDRIETVIDAEDISVVYRDYTAEELAAAIAPALVDVNGNSVAGDVVLSSKVKGTEAVGTFEVTFEYKGSYEYKPATKTVTVTVEKADASIDIPDVQVSYGEGYSVAPEVTLGNQYGDTAELTDSMIQFVVGLDIAEFDYDEDGVKGLNGKVQLILPAELQEMLDGILGLTGGDTSNGMEMSLSELMGYLDILPDESTGSLNQALEAILSVVEAGDLTITIGGTLPTEAGAYLYGAVTTSSNYETAFDVAYIVIAPALKEVYLDWNYTDTNGIFTWELLKHVDLGATAYVDPEFTTVDEAATDVMQNLFFGINTDGELVVELHGKHHDLEALEASLGNGAYTQLAFTLDIGNELVYAVPIVRAFLLVPNVANVQLVDAEGNALDTFNFTFDNAPKQLYVMVDGELVECDVTYTGVQTNLTVYEPTTEAPKHAGAYGALAVYTNTNENGEVISVGLDAAAIVIAPAQSTIEVTGGTFVHDGEAHGVTVVAPGDVTMLSGTVTFNGSVEGLGIEDVQGVLNVDFPAWLDKILSEKFADAYANGVSTKSFLFKLQQHEAAMLELGITEEIINSLTNLMKNLPDNVVVHFNDNAVYTDPGVYAYYGIVTDSDYIPSSDTGLVIIQKEGTVVDMLDTTAIYNGEGQFVNVYNPDNNDYVTIIVDRENNIGNIIIEDDLSDLVARIEDALGYELPESINVTELYNAVDKILTAAEGAENLPAEAATILTQIRQVLNQLPQSGVVYFNGEWLPTNVGEYEFYGASYSLKYTTNLTEAVLTIVPAELTVVLDDVTVHQDKEIPELTYTMNGLAEGDEVTVTVSCEADSAVVGEYPITAEVEAGKNYTVTVVDGTLTVEAHDVVVDEAVAPNCTNTGLTEGSHCSICGKVLVAQEVVPATGHSGTVNITQPTCTENGYGKGVCDICGETFFYQEIPATGHTEEIIPAVAPDCTNTGLTEGVKCSVCGEVLVAQEVVPATGHSGTVNITPSTCTEKGKAEGICDICGKTFFYQEFPLKAHTEGEVVVENEVDPTFDAAGSYDNVVYCTVCGKELSRETVSVPALVAVAQNTNTGARYEKLSEAIAEVQNGETIVFLTDIDEDVTIKQVKNVAFTIDGANYKYTGTMTVNGTGYAGAQGQALTIQNVNFVVDGYGIYAYKKNNYARNVTVDGCTFTGEANDDYGIALRHVYNITVKNTTGTGLFDLVYGGGAVTGFTAENVTVTDSNNGIVLSYVNSTATFKNVTTDATDDGVIIRNNAGGTVTFEDCNIDNVTYWQANITKALKMYFNDATNNLEVGEGSEMLTIVLNNVDTTVTCATEGLTAIAGEGLDDYEVVYEGGVYKLAKPVAKIGDVKYTKLSQAIAEVQNGETIVFLTDIDEDVTIKQVKNVAFTIDGADYKYTGTMTVNGTGYAKDQGQALTIQNVNFVVDGYGIYAYQKNNYARNVTVDGCTFTGTEGENNDYGIALRHVYNITVKNTTGTGLIDLVYGGGAVTGFTAENVTVTDSVQGIWLSYPTGSINLTNVTTTDSENVGVGFYNYATGTVTFTGCAIDKIAYTEKGTKALKMIFNDQENNLEVGETNDKLTIVLNNVDTTVTCATEGLTAIAGEGLDKYTVVYEGGKYFLKEITYVAQIGETKYESIQDAVNAAVDGDTVVVIADHEMTWDGETFVDGSMASMVVVAGKTVTIDLNGKAVTVDANKMNGTDLYSVFAADEGGNLTLKDSVGTGSVNATGVAFASSNTTAYCLMMAYEPGTSLTVENGTYYMESAHDCLIYSGGDKCVTVNDGNYTLGNVGYAPVTGNNGKPWIFNVLGANDRTTIVNGGTYNADIDDPNYQYWQKEVTIPEDKCCAANGDGTWTVKAHAEEILPGKAANCTETGLTEGKKCANCGEILVAQEEIPATGHSGTVNITPATCTENGYGKGVCDICGEIFFYQEIPAKGHTEAEPVEEMRDTDNDGTEDALYEVVYCSVCGEMIREKLIAQYVCWNPATSEYYTDLSDALTLVSGAEAEEIEMLADVEEMIVMVYPNTTLDLNGKNVTATYVVGLNGSDVTDSTRAGLLKVASQFLTLATDNMETPVRVEAEGGYRFGSYYVDDDDAGLGLVVGEDGTLTYSFVTKQSGALKKYFTDNGASDNEIKVLVHITWIDAENNEEERTYTYNDDLIKAVANGGNKYTLKITGLEGMKHVTVCAMVVAGTYAQVQNSTQVHAITFD